MQATRPWRTAVRYAAPALAIVAAIAATASGATPAGARQEPSGDAGLGAVRALTERYQSEAAALADGFTGTDQCVPSMGYHYVNFSRMDTALEPSRPEALLYATAPNGSRRLVGAEWIVVDQDQNLATDDDRPALYGHEFDGPMPGHEPGMPVHYDLHAYAWLDNPDGGFTTWNPAISCP
jgi:hypothetical protein